jgi:hypothetical protein
MDEGFRFGQHGRTNRTRSPPFPALLDWQVPVATIDAIRLPAQHFAFTHSNSLRQGVEPLATEQNADGSRTSATAVRTRNRHGLR